MSEIEKLKDIPLSERVCKYHNELRQELWKGQYDCESCVEESARQQPYDDDTQLSFNFGDAE